MVRQLPREAEMLRKARIEMGYTQQQVATLIGVHIKADQRLEDGDPDIRDASMKIRLAICAVLCIDPMLLVFGGEFKAMAVFRTE